MRRFNLQVHFAILVVLFCTNAPATGKEGFGSTKVTVELARVRPPDVYVSGTRIAVRSSGQGRSDATESQLIASLESVLLGNESRFQLDTENPQTVVEVAVVDNEATENWETRQESRLVKTGTDSKGKPRYSQRTVSVRYKVVTQVFSVAYRVRDLRTGASLDADNLTRNYNDDFENGEGAPNRSQLEAEAVASVVDDVARRLTPTTESVGVLVPKGSYKDLLNLARSGLWNRYLEALESMPAKTRPQEEAYRQYALGVAYEALGYAAEDSEIVLSYLEQASINYNAAIEGNPKEKFFTRGFKGSQFLANWKSFLKGSDGKRKQATPPVERVRTAMAQYQKVLDFKSADATRIAEAEGAKSALGEGNSGVVVDNASIIEMARAGIPEDIILTALDTATATDLDASPKGLIELAEAKVGTKVIQRIQSLASAGHD